MPSSIAILCVSIGLLASPVSGVSLSAEKSIVRAEAKGGKNIKPAAASWNDIPIEALTRVDLSQEKAKPSQKQASGTGSLEGISTCDLDYPLGPDQCSCQDPDDSTKVNDFIMDGEECLQAAKEANVSAPGPISYWRLSSADDYWQVRFPKGCFVLKPTTTNTNGCQHDPRGVCYFYNEIGDDPPYCKNQVDPNYKMSDGTVPAMDGVPVCKRARYLYGTTNTNGQGTDCPLGYSLIESESRCLLASKCQGYRTDCSSEYVANARNQSEYNIHPLGCFEQPHWNASLVSDDCVNYNRRIAGFPLPSAPVGKPICMVTYPTNFTHVDSSGSELYPIIHSSETVHHLDSNGSVGSVVTNSASNGIGSATHDTSQGR